MPRSRALLAPLLLAAAFAGCASDDPGAPAATPPATTPTAATPDNASALVELSVATSGAYPVNPGFSPASLQAEAGQRIKLTFTNAEAAPLANHDWVLEGVADAKTEVVAPGQTSTIEFEAPPAGEYEYYCSIGDHRARGMEGTFTVK